jgi:hypothetical protein
MADAVANGVGELDVVKDFEELFPGSHHFISYYSGTKGDPTWNSKIGLHGRYVLSVKFNIKFNESRTHPVRQGEPKFFIRELDDIRPNGFSYTDRQLEFSLAEWIKLVESEGDFEVIGYPMIKDQPLDGFEGVWRKS